MATYGQSTIAQIGRSIQVSADGRPLWKHIGVTIDWTTVAAVAGSDVTFLDGVLVQIGEKALRYGQVLTKITASGKYGPYDPAATDGRQLLVVGEAFFLNETAREDDVASDHPAVCYGGLCFLSRFIQSGVAAASLALGPTLANLLATFPQLEPVKE
jgi:uncharacterized protein (DUF433 family)